jgi:hypothetical protein
MSTSPLTERCLEKFGETLIGRADMKDALKKLDKLTQEEARMTVAQTLKATLAVDDKMRGVAHTVATIDNTMANVNDRVASVDERIAGIDERVTRTAHIIEDWVRSQEHEPVVDDRVASNGDPVADVVNGAQIILTQA